MVLKVYCFQKHAFLLIYTFIHHEGRKTRVDEKQNVTDRNNGVN